MIRFSFSSFYMSCIFANIMILFLHVAFRHDKILLKLGVPVLYGTLAVILLRIAVPLEFMFLSHNILLTSKSASLISDFIAPNYFNERLSIWNFVEMAWLAGILAHAFRFFQLELKTAGYVRKYSRPLPPDSHAALALLRIHEELPKTRRLDAQLFPLVSQPVIYGLRKPRILLPPDLDLDESQFYYILRHEAAHFLRHDMALKLGVKLLSILYWWNPLCKFLISKTDTVLEMRVDGSVAKDKAQKADYLQCMLLVARHAAGANGLQTAQTISFCSRSSSALQQRFFMLMEKEPTVTRKASRMGVVLLLAVSFLVSYLYIFEAGYDETKYDPDILIPTAENSYFIKRSDGRYNFYMENEFWGIADSLEYYPDDIPIYTWEEVNAYETE